MTSKRRSVVGILAAGALATAATVAYLASGDVAAPDVRTGAVTQGAIVDAVQATGKVEPVTTVTVGSQVSGVISWLGADFNSVVRKGDVLARLDPSLLQAQVEQAEANLTKVLADVRQRQITMADAQMKAARAEKLAASGLVSSTDLEAARIAVQMADTNIEAADAQVVQARASLNQAKVNLNHAVITSPIDGIVIERSVDVGQTVAASLSSPTIFLLAADLTKMRVNTNVDEGDISKIAPGQSVSVTVDAYPRETFRGVVSQIRLRPEVVSNVTSYITIVDVANDEAKLKPGMTATAVIEVASRADVVRVPNASLRFKPLAATFAALGQVEPVSAAPDRRATLPDGDVVTAAARGGATVVDAMLIEVAPPSSAGPADRGTRGEVWVYEDGALRRIPVRLGLADGTNTEVLSGDLTPGMTVVTGVVMAATTAVTRAPSTLFSGSAPGGFGGGPGGGRSGR